MKKIPLCIAFLLVSCGFMSGQTYKVLYSFGSVSNDGNMPNQALISDSSGNIYGTTQFGGDTVDMCPELGCGTVFELSPQIDGTWVEKIIYNFCESGGGNFDCPDGDRPQAGLTIDASGNLYGTTSTGGLGCPQADGCGTVFELSPPLAPSGNWAHSTLWNFCMNDTCVDGDYPLSQLVFDGAQALYGTTFEGGVLGLGTIFQLSPSTNGFQESVIYDFGSRYSDGMNPVAGVTFDKYGSLYGTTQYSVKFKGGNGTIYRVSPKVRGGWSRTWVLGLSSMYGESVSPVQFDSAGNLYAGTLFEDGAIVRVARSTGAETVSPVPRMVTSLLIDKTTNTLFGTAGESGTNGLGVLFKMNRNGTESVLYNFCSQPLCVDGANPGIGGGPLLLRNGTLYGTAAGGAGTPAGGIVFGLTP